MTIGVFAAIPAMKALVWPQSASALDQLCQTVSCRPRGGNDGCCVGPPLYSGEIYDCYDHLDLQYYCYSVCVLDGGYCV